MRDYPHNSPTRRRTPRYTAPAPPDTEEFDEEEEYLEAQSYDVRGPRSVRRMMPPQGDTRLAPTYTGIRMRRHEIPARRSARPTTEDFTAPPRAERQGTHWMVYVGMALVIMLLGWVVLSSVTTWWTNWQNDQHYGRPRTFQTDAVVGHNHDSSAHPSHFITINLHSQVIIYEIPAGDPTKTTVYTGPLLSGEGSDLYPVTLEFKDVTGDGKLAMIPLVNGQVDTNGIFLNTGDKFRPRTTQDSIQLIGNADDIKLEA